MFYIIIVFFFVHSCILSKEKKVIKQGKNDLFLSKTIVLLILWVHRPPKDFHWTPYQSQLLRKPFYLFVLHHFLVHCTFAQVLSLHSFSRRDAWQSFIAPETGNRFNGEKKSGELQISERMSHFCDKRGPFLIVKYVSVFCTTWIDVEKRENNRNKRQKAHKTCSD